MTDPARFFLARVGKDGDHCDTCAERILPHALCMAGTDGSLRCMTCHGAAHTPKVLDALRNPTDTGDPE